MCCLAASSIGLCTNAIGVFYTPVSKSLHVLKGTFAIHATLSTLITALTSLKMSKLIRKYNYNNKKFVAVQDYKKEIYNHTTMSRFKGRSKGIHIDYIFVTDNLSIKSTEILTYNENGKYPSDHYPLISEVE